MDTDKHSTNLRDRINFTKGEPDSYGGVILGNAAYNIAETLILSED